LSEVWQTHSKGVPFGALGKEEVGYRESGCSDQRARLSSVCAGRLERVGGRRGIDGESNPPERRCKTAKHNLSLIYSAQKKHQSKAEIRLESLTGS
jgi:hypothetical protein